jgi:hypothetical protein
VPHIPADAVHGQVSFARVFFREAFERALKFAAREAQLLDKRVKRHE